MSPTIDCLKKGEFLWTKAAGLAFAEIKKNMINAPMMWLPDFDKVFEVESDASHNGIGGVSSQEKHPITLFIEKINDA